MDNKSKKRKSKYLTEPYFSAMMQAIKKVRFEGWKVRQACTKYRVPNRSLVRYIEVSSDESSPFYVNPRVQPINNNSNIGQFPPIRGISADASTTLSASRDVPTSQQYNKMGCEPTKLSNNKGHCMDKRHFPEDDFFSSTPDSPVFDDTDQLISNNQESLATPSFPIFDSSINARATAAKLPAVTEPTNHTPKSKGMEVEKELESQLEIEDCHIQCFLQDIADIDFGF